MEYKNAINSLHDLLDIVDEWEKTHPEPHNPEWVWFRGQPDAEDDPLPGVLRQNFLKRAEQMPGPPKGRGLTASILFHTARTKCGKAQF